jgi:hypothetical protein
MGAVQNLSDILGVIGGAVTPAIAAAVQVPAHGWLDNAYGLHDVVRRSECSCSAVQSECDARLLLCPSSQWAAWQEACTKMLTGSQRAGTRQISALPGQSQGAPVAEPPRSGRICLPADSRCGSGSQRPSGRPICGQLLFSDLRSWHD